MSGLNILRYALALIALLVFMPNAARAQRGGRSGFSTEAGVNAAEYWIEVRAFGHCFVRQFRADAFGLLATRPGSNEEAADLNRLFQREYTCLTGLRQISFASRHVRGTFAEGLILDGTPVPPELALAAPAPGAPIRSVIDAALCYVAAHGADVRALVTETRPGSAQELAAIQRIGPVFLECVPPASRGMRFGATDLRYVLAEALLRLRPDAPAPAAQH